MGLKGQEKEKERGGGRNHLLKISGWGWHRASAEGKCWDRNGSLGQCDSVPGGKPKMRIKKKGRGLQKKGTNTRS